MNSIAAHDWTPLELYALWIAGLLLLYVAAGVIASINRRVRRRVVRRRLARLIGGQSAYRDPGLPLGQPASPLAHPTIARGAVRRADEGRVAGAGDSASGYGHGTSLVFPDRPTRRVNGNGHGAA